MSIEWPKPKRKFDDVTNEEIKEWTKQIAEKIRSMGENALYLHAANEVLPKNLDSDARHQIDRDIVRELPDDVSEMIKAKNIKVKKSIITPAMERGAWKAEMDEAKIKAGKGKGSRRITPLPPKEKKTTQVENQMDLFNK